MRESTRGDVLFVLPVLGQPRDAKRIAMLQAAGFVVKGVAFDRQYHRGRMPECEVEILATIEHRKYLKRLVILASVVPALRRAIRRADVVYASGPDMGLAAVIAGWGTGTPAIFEVGDVQRAQVSGGLLGNAVRLLDRFGARSAKLIVTTAQGFVDEYYRRWLGVETPALLLENKLESSVMDAAGCDVPSRPAGSPGVDRPLRVGYFGLLRCEWSWRVLEALAKAYPTAVEVVVAGRPIDPTNLPERAAGLPNVDFRGEYRSPDDLPGLYGDVDLVWGSYPYPKPDELNWRWARTNRFYESCRFGRPIIGLEGSADLVEILRLDIGMSVGGDDVRAAADRVAAVSVEDLDRWAANLRELPRAVYEYTSEGEDLARKIDTILDVDH